MFKSKLFCCFIIGTILMGFTTLAFGQVVVTFPDVNLDAKIRAAIGIPTAPIYDTDLIGLTELDASGAEGSVPADQIATLGGLEYCTDLIDLDLSNNQLDDGVTSDVLLPLAGLTNLTTLSLHTNQIIDISPLATLFLLTDLYLDNNQISDISPLAALSNMTKLDLDNNQIDDISALETLTLLTELDMDNNQISDISPLAALTNLTRLYLGYNQISDINPLAALTNLTRLYLGYNQISDINPLGDLSNLTWLFLSDNQISDISPLDDLTALTRLELDVNQIINISPLAALSLLTKLYLDNNQIIDISEFVTNSSINGGSTVGLEFNPLNCDSILTQIPILLGRGASVSWTVIDDVDGDGIEDDCDTCPNDADNDSDGDGICGDVDTCPNDSEDDSDGDGICGDVDNCPIVANPGQEDADGDGIGDACDTCPNDADNDSDGDGICGDVDACPNDADNDSDGDGICGDVDACPNDADNDSDGDGICGDVDACPNDADNDSDGDGICGDVDACPNDADNDSDGDGICGDVDACPNDADNDSDGDGICGDVDACPNDADNDSDGDGICGDVDACPNDAENDSDGDGICGDVDACPNDADNDSDGDGICGDVDACPNDADNDSDGDGICGDVDACPNDADNDSDGDGICGDVDACPNDADNDSDGDGICGDVDPCPDSTANNCNPPTSVSLTSNLPSPQVEGTEVTFTALATGVTGSYEYRFLVRNVFGRLIDEQPYSSSNTFQYSGGSGNYIIVVLARTTGSTKTYQVYNKMSFKFTPIPAPTSVSLTSNLPSPQVEGTEVTFTALATGVTGSYEYRFLVRNVFGRLIDEQPYSSSNTFQYSGGSGNYIIVVLARNAGSTKTYQVYNKMSFKFTPIPAPTSVSLNSNLSSPQVEGTEVTFTALATGVTGSYEYRFLVRNVFGRLIDEQPYSSSNTFQYSGGRGTYIVVVLARNEGSTKTYQVYNKMRFRFD